MLYLWCSLSNFNIQGVKIGVLRGGKFNGAIFYSESDPIFGIAGKKASLSRNYDVYMMLKTFFKAVKVRIIECLT